MKRARLEIHSYFTNNQQWQRWRWRRGGAEDEREASGGREGGKKRKKGRERGREEKEGVRESRVESSRDEEGGGKGRGSLRVDG